MDPIVIKVKWKPSLKVVNSGKHSVKGYADYVALISSKFDIYATVLQLIDQRAGDLDLHISQTCEVCIW